MNKIFIPYTRTPLGNTDSVPVFSPDFYWGKAPAPVLEEAIKVIDDKGWNAFDEKYRGKFDFTNDETRADWRFPISIDKNSVVLDIGAGMGRSTVPLARVAGTVVAFDQSTLRMRYLARRLKKEGLENVQIFVGDIFSLPIADGTFDVIAMNGILEWVGLSKKFTSADEAQKECLRICARLLKKDGTLYVGIENRIAAAYLKAADHGGLMYTSFMPRFIARKYTELRQGRDYRTYTYSKEGYDKLFRSSGYTDINFLMSYPGYNLPRIVWPYDNLNMFRYVLQSLMPANTFARRIFKWLAGWTPVLVVYRRFFYSFNIIAKK